MWVVPPRKLQLGLGAQFPMGVLKGAKLPENVEIFGLI